MAIGKIKTIFLLFSLMPLGRPDELGFSSSSRRISVQPDIHAAVIVSEYNSVQSQATTEFLLSTDTFTTIQAELPITPLDVDNLDIGFSYPCHEALVKLCAKLGIPMVDPMITFCKCFGEFCPGPETAAQLALRQKIANMNAAQMTFDTHNLIYMGILCGIFVLGIGANLLVIITLLKYLPKENVTNMFLLSLAISDILFLAICIPVRVINYANYYLILPVASYWVCYFTQFMFYYSFICSILTLTIIGTERYIAICYPMKAQEIGTTGRARKILVCIWVASLILAAPSLLDVTVAAGGCMLDSVQLKNRKYHIYYFFIVGLCIPLLILTTVYTRICITLWKSVRIQHRLNQQASISAEKHGKNGGNSKDDTGGRKKVIRLMIAVLITFICCWTPLLVFQVIEYQLEMEGFMSLDYFDRLRKPLDTITFGNAVFIPVMYAFLSSQFRDGLKKCFGFTGVKKRQGSAFGGESKSRQTQVSIFKQEPSKDVIEADQASKNDAIKVPMP